MSDPQTRKLSHYFTHSKRKGRPGLPLASVTMNDGLVLRKDMDRKMDTSLSAEEHSLVEPGDIAYNMMRMWQGAFGLASAPVNVSPAYVVMRAKPTLDSRFAAHWLKSDRALYLLWAFSYGLTDDRLRLYPKEFLQIPVQWPDVAEQRRIAAVLDAWDDAIAIAERLVTAREVARVSLATKVYLDQGRIRDAKSAGWGQLRSVAKVIRCSAEIGVKDVMDTGSPLFTAGGVAGLFSPSQESGEAVILSAIGARCGRCFFADGSWTAGANTLIIRPKSGQSARFLFHYLDIFQPWPIQGSGQPYIGPKQANEAVVPIRSTQEQGVIADLLDCASDAVKLQVEKVDLLRNQKRAIMQKLLTGQWPVPESIDALLATASEVTV